MRTGPRLADLTDRGAMCNALRARSHEAASATVPERQGPVKRHWCAGAPRAGGGGTPPVSNHTASDTAALAIALMCRLMCVPGATGMNPASAAADPLAAAFWVARAALMEPK